MIIPADRTIQALPDGRYAVSASLLLERYEIERGLRLALARCEGDQAMIPATHLQAVSPCAGGEIGYWEPVVNWIQRSVLLYLSARNGSLAPEDVRCRVLADQPVEAKPVASGTGPMVSQ